MMCAHLLRHNVCPVATLFIWSEKEWGCNLLEELFYTRFTLRCRQTVCILSILIIVLMHHLEFDRLDTHAKMVW